MPIIKVGIIAVETDIRVFRFISVERKGGEVESEEAPKRADRFLLRWLTDLSSGALYLYAVEGRTRGKPGSER